MSTLSALQVDSQLPLLIADAIAHIASPQLRVRTTLGGNLLQRPRCLYFRHPAIPCFKKGGGACPAKSGPVDAFPGALSQGQCVAAHPSDLAPALIALNATAEVISPAGLRSLSLAEMYAGAASNRDREACLAHDEVLTVVVFPDEPLSQAFIKIAAREANEFSEGTAAVTATADQGYITSVRIALGGVAPEPLLCKTAQALIRKPLESIRPVDVARELISRELGRDANRSRAVAAQVAVQRALACVLKDLQADRGRFPGIKA